MGNAGAVGTEGMIGGGCARFLIASVAWCFRRAKLFRLFAGVSSYLCKSVPTRATTRAQPCARAHRTTDADLSDLMTWSRLLGRIKTEPSWTNTSCVRCTCPSASLGLWRALMRLRYSREMRRGCATCSCPMLRLPSQPFVISLPFASAIALP